MVIDMPLKPYLVKFARRTEKTPICINEVFLFETVEINDAPEEWKEDNEEDYLPIRIPNIQTAKIATFFLIENSLEMKFKNAIFFYVQGRIQLRKGVKRAVLDFFDMYEITEDDYPVETALRNYRRMAENQRSLVVEF